MKFEVVEKLSSATGVTLSCQVLGVSRSGYYDWLKSPESERKKQNEILLQEIREIHVKSRGIYGVP